jgi:hypothetical protein
MSRATRMVSVHDEVIIAFLLFCLEIYRAEEQRKRKLHQTRPARSIRAIWLAGRNGAFFVQPASNQ